MFVTIRSVRSYPSSREWDTHREHAGHLFILFIEVVLLKHWESQPRTTIHVALYRGEMGWSLLKVTAKLLLVLSVQH